ncbi:MAG: DUF721 domain-containing protein [Spirochaetia bacterium]|nr:DUF721 domain-containing protein [Spirochaetia bacterium]
MIKRFNDHDIRFLFKKITSKLPEKNKIFIQKETNLIQIQKNWQVLAGEGLASHSTPLLLKENELYVTADHPIFAQQILLLQNEIRSKISETLPLRIKNIKVKTGRIKWKTAPENSLVDASSPNSLTNSLKRKDIMSHADKMVSKKEMKQEYKDSDKIKAIDLLINTLKKI